VRGFPANESVKEGYLPKSSHFAVIGSSSVKTVTDELFRCMNIDDLEQFSTFKIRDFRKKIIRDFGLRHTF